LTLSQIVQAASLPQFTQAIELADSLVTITFGDHRQSIPYSYIHGVASSINYLMVFDNLGQLFIFKKPNEEFLVALQNKVAQYRTKAPPLLPPQVNP